MNYCKSVSAQHGSFTFKLPTGLGEMSETGINSHSTRLYAALVNPRRRFPIQCGSYKKALRQSSCAINLSQSIQVTTSNQV